MESFFNLEYVRVVDVDASPTSKKLQVIWNPPYKDPVNRYNGRRSALEETIRLIMFLVFKGVRTICFAKSRRACEILFKETQHSLEQIAPDYVERIHSYRGGYSAEDRRYIEGQLFRGELLCIIATNALELGIDIGSLDCVIHFGFPESIASFRQQSGRAGRRGRDSLSILVTDGDNMLDQYYFKNPDELFNKDLESIVLDLDNETILEGHLQCAASELRLSPQRDFKYFGEEELIEDLCEKQLLKDSKNGVFFSHPRFKGNPAGAIKIRSIDEDMFQVIDISTNSEIEKVEISRVPFTLYDGAIFIHQGNTFLIFDVNAERKYAKGKPTTVNYLTAPSDIKEPIPIDSLELLHLGKGASCSVVSFGRVRGKLLYDL